jgi:hypothetical protein
MLSATLALVLTRKETPEVLNKSTYKQLKPNKRFSAGMCSRFPLHSKFVKIPNKKRAVFSLSFVAMPTYAMTLEREK